MAKTKKVEEIEEVEVAEKETKKKAKKAKTKKKIKVSDIFTKGIALFMVAAMTLAACATTIIYIVYTIKG